MQPFSPTHTHPLNSTDQHIQRLLPEDGDNEEHLKVDFDYGFAYYCSWEEGAERNAKVSTGDACQIKERIGDGGADKNCPEAIFLHIIVNHQFCTLEKSQFVSLPKLHQLC